MIQFQKAQKLAKPLKVFTYGPTGSGKTMSSLLLANGFVQSIRKCDEKKAWEHILLIDTEYGRGSLYSSLGEYLYYGIDAPYTPDKLMNVIKEANNSADIDAIIIDSFTHFWSKDGGMLEQKAVIDSKGGNSYTSWNALTPQWNALVDCILKSPKQVLVTARAKSDVVLEQDPVSGKSVPKTYGLKPDLRDGFEFEPDITINIDKDNHSILVEKGLPGMERVYSIATVDLGKDIYNLSQSNAVTPMRSNLDIAASIRSMCGKDRNLVAFVGNEVSGKKLEDLPYEEIVSLEAKVIAEIKKKQVKK